MPAFARLRRAGALAVCLASCGLLSGCLGSWSEAGLQAKRGQGMTRDFQASHAEILDIAKTQALNSAWEGKAADDTGAYAWFNDIFGGAGEAIMVSPTSQGVTTVEAFFQSMGMDGRAMELAILDSISQALSKRRSEQYAAQPHAAPAAPAASAASAASAEPRKQWYDR